MEAILQLASLAGAAFSTVTTVYFWFVRVKRERPNLKTALAERELFLGRGIAETRELGLKLSLVVANYSALPDAVLSVRLWVRQRAGGWLELGNVAFDPKTPRPFNVPALQTVLLCVNGCVGLPREEGLELGGNKALAAYADKHFASPREVKVELTGLNEARHVAVVTWKNG